MEAKIGIDTGLCFLCLGKARGSLCVTCHNDIFQDNVQLCVVCGNKINTSTCGYCSRKKPLFNHSTILCHYQYPVDRLIKALKFQGKPELINIFVQPFIEKLSIRESLPEKLIPVPLHYKRQAERGFNQSALLAKKLSLATGIDIDTSLFVRKKHTLPQSSLFYKDRKKNIANAFAITRKTNSSHVAIVDDVITTGSTINEMTKLLRKAGVNFIEVWAIAKTIHGH